MFLRSQYPCVQSQPVEEPHLTPVLTQNTATSDAHTFTLPRAFEIWNICSGGGSAVIKPKAPIQDLVFLEVSERCLLLHSSCEKGTTPPRA